MNSARKRGFTLIELLIVILIIAIMSAVIVPGYVRFLGHARFRSKVREVQDIFAYAREQAVSLNAVVTVSFDKQSESFSVKLPTPPTDTDLPVAISGADAGESAHGQAAPVPRTVQLGAEQSVGTYNISTSALATASPNAAQQAAGSQTGPNDIQFQGDGTSEGLEMTISQADGAHAHLTLAPATGRLSIDVGQSI